MTKGRTWGAEPDDAERAESNPCPSGAGRLAPASENEAPPVWGTGERRWE